MRNILGNYNVDYINGRVTMVLEFLKQRNELVRSKEKKTRKRLHSATQYIYCTNVTALNAISVNGVYRLLGAKITINCRIQKIY